MFIPHTAVRKETLLAIVEEFVSREGTDYGPSAFSFESKVQSVLKQLERGEACLVFDPVSESCDLVIKGSLRHKQVVAALASKEEA
jgi:uncharacterized protein YheU (UPF0270 family)